jgi:DNA-binding IscR family transcriptional regulator
MSGDAHDLVEAGLWLSVSEIARQKDKSRQAIAKRVDSLVEAGLLETRPGPGGTKLVNLAQFDRAVGEVGDAFKESAAETRAEIEIDTSPASPALRDHQSRAAQYTADLKFLDLEERLGRLVPIEEAKIGGIKIGEAVVRIIGRLPTYAEAMTAIAVKDGVQGSRGLFKDIERDLRVAIAEAIGEIARAAVPSTIDPGEDSSPV